MSLFEKGMKKLGGRTKGVKNRLSHAFLTALAEDFEQHGVDAIKIARVERPVEYVRIVAGLMPRELEITETQLMQIPDDELDAFIEFARQRLAQRALSAGIRETETIN
jgi:hypothetical protein